MNASAQLIKDAIEGKFNQQSTIDGRKFVMSADISVQVAKSETEAIDSGADNIAEVGYQNLQETDGTNIGGAAFHVAGENFDRMVMEISPDFADGIIYPGFEVNAAHEFGAHLLAGLHNDLNQESFFHSPGGNNFLQEDFERLFRQSRRTTPPPPYGSKLTNLSVPISFSRALTSTTSGFEVRQANLTVSSSAEVYRWSNGVKR